MIIHKKQTDLSKKKKNFSQYANNKKKRKRKPGPDGLIHR